ncbi:PAS domain-containing protein, partial [Kaarinaea lacus]
MKAKVHQLFQQSLLQCINEPLVLIDPIENKIIGSNPAATVMLGYKHETLLSHTVTSIFPFELPALITFTQAVLENGSGWTNEMSCRHQDGHEIQVEVSASLYDTALEKYIIFQLRDKQKIQQLQEQSQANDYVRRGISEWKRIERIFQDIERENQLLLRAVGDGIYGVNADGKTTFVNMAAERMLGWSADELVGKDIHELIHYHRSDGSHYPRVECPIYAAFHDGAIHRVDDEV